ncbi:MAG: radical SAM protein [Gemmatimonadales bacterium]|nr:radical SAM protein [Gemmatimonadales bacterium]NIN13177.1 radical SAM protein [Gemmatimonadales bacterium]NIN51455.1 radical SAM protein [Gemmatimonadales bacterium]NIP08919.1 radical SAM protein [Gemmatimonadales bacterium]NIR03707.1 radical SAM protein [Gemmatimonadales bacterium]
MKQQSRRRFIETVSSLAVASVGSTLPSLFTECRKQARAQSQIDPDFEPGYLKLHRSGELKRRGEQLWQVMKSCSLCPRECGAARLDGQAGFCHGTSQLVIASHHPHFGEERPLVGRGGSGTVFFSNCNLRCVFCINWQISQGGVGESRSLEDLAEMMLHLQGLGCHNINIVTPTHYSPHIVLALDIAAARGLRLPLVYNTCGWERPEILRKLDGVVDIYLPDFKYADGAMASTYSSGADTYPEITKAALLEMHRQVGVAKPAEDGLMYRGLMIRHLVMPNGVSGAKQVIGWIAENLPKDTYVNIMSQYRPMYKAFDYPEIARQLTRAEYTEVVEYARQAGLTNLDIQGASR